MRKRYFNIVFVIIFSVLYIYAQRLREGIDCVPGEILVVYKKGVSESKIKAFHKAKGLSEIKTFFATHKKKDKFYHLKLKPGITVEQAIEEYKKNPDVEIVQPNYIYYPCVFPNDTSFSSLWGLHNTGQTVNGTTGTPDADIDVPEAWDISTGTSTVVVAVIDSGVAYNHPDLQSNIWTNPGEIPNNGIDDDNNGFVDDYYGWDFFSEDNDPLGLDEHGTYVAGIIGAVGNNNNGVCGVNWNVKIIALRGMGISGSRLYGTTSSLTPCISYAVSKGAKIINASWGRVGGYDLIQYNAINSAKNSGVLFVASAGNGGDDRIGDDNDIYPHYPSNYDLDNIIAVAATDQDVNLPIFFKLWFNKRRCGCTWCKHL
jgi:subtilisin family serine protease